MSITEQLSVASITETRSGMICAQSALSANVLLVGQLNVGVWLSPTVTIAEQELVLSPSSVTVRVTVCGPF